MKQVNVEVPKNTEIEQLRAKVEELTKEIEKKEAENRYVRGEIKKIAEKVETLAKTETGDFDVQFKHTGIEGAEYFVDYISGKGFYTPPSCLDEIIDEETGETEYVSGSVCRPYTDDEVAHLSHGLNQLLEHINSTFRETSDLLISHAYVNGLDNINGNDDGISGTGDFNLYNAVLNYFKRLGRYDYEDDNDITISVISDDVVEKTGIFYEAVLNSSRSDDNNVTISVVSHYTEEELLHGGHWYFADRDGCLHKEEEAIGENWEELFFILDGWVSYKQFFRGIDTTSNKEKTFGELSDGSGIIDVSSMMLEVGLMPFYKPGRIGQHNEYPDCWKIVVEGAVRNKSIYIPKKYNSLKLFRFLMKDAIAKRYSQINTLRSNNIELDTNLRGIINEQDEKFRFARHDILNLMSFINAPINGFNQSSGDDMRPNIYRCQLENIQEKVTDLLPIIKNILTPNRENAKDKDEYTLSDLINTVIKQIWDMAVASHIKFIVDINGNLPREFSGDPSIISRILFNLLTNAIKYTKESYAVNHTKEGGKISLIVSGHDNGDDTATITIVVEDNGIGIDKKYWTKIFERGVRVDPDKNKNIEGSGTGLAITKRFTEDILGGKISIESEQEDVPRGKKGWSRFTVTLPKQKVKDSKPAAFVKNPTEKSVLVYFTEYNEYIDSVLNTIDKLGVSGSYAPDESIFLEKFKEKIKNKNKPFSHVFVTPALVGNAKKICDNLNLSPKIVLLAMLKEDVNDKGMDVLNLPASSITIANILNDKPNELMGRDHRKTSSFTAPDARILAVDDKDNNLDTIKKWLLPYEMHVDTCNSGKEAIEKVKTKTYDLVFMDHQMPGMDGVETAKHIIAQNKELPIVALTANADDPDVKKQFRQVGVNDFLSKPIDPNELDRILMNCIRTDKQKKKIRSLNKAVPVIENLQNHNITIGGIDVNCGISSAPGETVNERVENYLEMLDAVRKEWLEEINNLTTDDLKEYVRCVHNLKSSAAEIRANKLSECAKELEAAGKRLMEDAENREDREFIETHNPKLIQDLKSILDNIDDYLKKKNVSDGKT